VLVDTLAGRETATSRPTWASGRGLPSNRFGGSVYGYEDGFPLMGGGLSCIHTPRRPAWGILARLRVRNEAGVSTVGENTPALIKAVEIGCGVGPVIYVS